MYAAQIFTLEAHSKQAKKINKTKNKQKLNLPYWSLVFLFTNLTRFLQTTFKILRLIQSKQKTKIKQTIDQTKTKLTKQQN